MVDNSLTTMTDVPLILKGFSDSMLFTSYEFSNWSFLNKLQGQEWSSDVEHRSLITTPTTEITPNQKTTRIC